MKQTTAAVIIIFICAAVTVLTIYITHYTCCIFAFLIITAVICYVYQPEESYQNTQHKILDINFNTIIKYPITNRSI